MNFFEYIFVCVCGEFLVDVHVLIRIKLTRLIGRRFVVQRCRMEPKWIHSGKLAYSGMLARGRGRGLICMNFVTGGKIPPYANEATTHFLVFGLFLADAPRCHIS